MKKGLLITLIILIVFSIMGITFAAEKVTLRLAWWGNPTRDARTLEVVKMYMAQNPNVTIETETTSFTGYWDKLGAQSAANNLPDIIQHDYAYITQYATKGLLLDLTPYVKSKKLDISTVDEVYLGGGRVKKKLYGISLGTNAYAFIYDPAILQKAGVAPPTPDWTWADFEKMAIEVYKKTGSQIMPFNPATPNETFKNMIRQTGKCFYNPKNGASLGFTDAKLLTEFFDLQYRILKAGAMIKPEVGFLTVAQPEYPLAKGTAWIDSCWSNQLEMWVSAAGRPLALAVLPRIAGSKRPGTYLKPSMFFTVSKSSANKEEAVKFVNFFLNSNEANKVLLAERGVPIVPAVRDNLKELVNPVAKQAFDFVALVGNKNASPLDPADPANAPEVIKIFRTIDQEVLYGSTTPKDAAAKFIKQANEILIKNKAAK